MEYEEVARELKTLFDAKGYTWSIDGVSTIPTEADILGVLKEVDRRIANEPDGTWYETGRLIFIKESGFMDVYALQASVERHDEQSPTESVSEAPQNNL